MYIKKIMGENIGPIKKIQIDLPFKEKCPKPVIIVGENGTGKSTILSNIVDAFYEIILMHVNKLKQKDMNIIKQ